MGHVINFLVIFKIEINLLVTNRIITQILKIINQKYMHYNNIYFI